jgi:hypothetical protein
VSYLSMYYPCYQDWVETRIFYVMLSFAESRVNYGNWLTFCRIVSLGDPSRRMLMMVQECASTCYVLFWIVVVPASDPKDLFMNM